MNQSPYKIYSLSNIPFGPTAVLALPQGNAVTFCNYTNWLAIMLWNNLLFSFIL